MASDGGRLARRPVLLARHGRTAFNAEGRFQGRLAVPLDDEGRRQAAALAEQAAAHPVAAVLSSPLDRARETAAVVAARLGLEVVTDDRWAEIDVGDWSGCTHAEVGLDAVARFRDFARDPPGGERVEDVRRRVLAALADAPPGALVVSHGMALRILLRALGRPAPLLGNAQLLSVEQPPAGRP